MGNQDNKNFMDNVVEAQKQAADTIVENARKFTNGNAVVNETVQKGTEWYKNWLENQKSFFTNSTEKTADMTGNMQNNMNNMNEFYQNWFNSQMNWAKQAWETSNNYFQQANTGNTGATNPMDMWKNMQQNMNTWMTGVNNTNQWMSMMQQWNNMFNMDSYKKTTEDWTALYNQYQQVLNTNWTKMQEQMQNGTAQDAYKSMVNATDSFTKFYELWMPMWKSIQDKTFNAEVYKQWMNPVAYKELMDKYLGLMPESGRTYVQQMTRLMQDGAKQWSNMGGDQFQQMRAMFGNMMPAMNSSEMFGNMMTGYNQFYNAMNEAAAPFTRMMTPNQNTKNMMQWQDIANRIAVYNIRNTELQYMMYTQGTKVMDKLAENVISKVQNGEEVNSVMALFQEWMNISDKTFVSLFESDEYSKLMAEVSAMQLKLKKDIELQMEQYMTGIPVATRSEMDELYKTIYELKKQVRQMEIMMELDSEEEVEAPKTTRRATSKK